MKNRLKSMATPRTWLIKRKKNVWTLKPKGSHKIEHCLPIGTILRDCLKHAKTTRELKNIIYRKGILVDSKKISDIHHSIGIMDIVEVPELKEKYIMLINTRGQLYLEKTDLKFKVAKIIGKKKIGKKIQLNLFGGKNVVADKDDFKVGDTVLLDLKDYSIKDKINLAEGASCMLLGGSHIGEFGKIKKIQDHRITIEGEPGNEFETLKKFVYVTGKEKSLIETVKK